MLLREKAELDAWADEVRETAVQTYLGLQFDVLTATFSLPIFLTLLRSYRYGSISRSRHNTFLVDTQTMRATQ